MKYICFDLETLGNNSHAPIIQIGAVKFDENGIYDKFIVNCFHTDLSKYEVDYSTIMWWINQSQEARMKLNEYVIEHREALKLFLKWIGVPQDYLYYSMCTFDPPILDWALCTENLDRLPHRNQRDMRTIMDAIGEYEEFVGIKHYALDDAANEAMHVIKYLKTR